MVKRERIVLAIAVLGVVGIILGVGGFGERWRTEKEDINIESQIDSLSYSLGTFNAIELQKQGLNEINGRAVGMGINHVFNSDSFLITQEESQKILERYFGKLREEMEAEKQRIQDSILTESKKWIEERNVNEDPIITASGLQYEVLINGKGEHPTLENEVTVHYHGTFTNDTIFDSSIQRGQTASFGVTQVIKGWTEALQLMRVGDKWRLTIPSNLAYGEQGRPGILPNSDLIFIVELISIQ